MTDNVKLENSEILFTVEYIKESKTFLAVSTYMSPIKFCYAADTLDELFDKLSTITKKIDLFDINK